MSELKKAKIDPLLGGDRPDKPGTKEIVTPKIQVEKPVEPAKPIPKTTQADVKDTVAATKAILDAGPHVNFIIPLADGEAQGASDTVQINGYRLTIQKGVMVNIPMSVATLLAEKYRIQMEVGKDRRINRAPDVSEALS